MISPDWKRIAGMDVQADGTIGVVWLTLDARADRLWVYDSSVFRLEVPAVIADGISNHGRWIPIAWEKKAKPMMETLKRRGLNFTHEPHVDDDAVAEAVSRDMWGRMRSGRFSRDSQTAEWKDEYDNFARKEFKVPREGYPLMSATRYACAMFDEWARAEVLPGSSRKSYPAVAIV